MLLFPVFISSLGVLAQSPNLTVSVDQTPISFEGRTAKARTLTVRSQVPIPIEEAWELVQRPALLTFVARGVLRFIPVDPPLPDTWQAGETYLVKMRLLGFIPMGGIHYLQVDTVAHATYQISTQERDKVAKVWNHAITLTPLGADSIYYEDRILIYGGAMTGLLTRFARVFYKHRHRRWQIVAREGLPE